MVEKLDIAQNFIVKGFNIQKVIRCIGISNSTWYYNQNKKSKKDGRKKNKGRPIPGYSINPDGQSVSDSTIVTALKAYREKKEFVNAGGYQKLTHYIRRDYGFSVNHKKVYRLCKEHNLLLPKRKKNKRSSIPVSCNRVITGPNQLWEIDLKYGYIHGENRFFFILAIIDVFSRLLVNYHIGLRCLGKDLVFTLKTAQIKYKTSDNNLVIRTDGGTQMTSNVFKNHINNYKEGDLIHELIPPATPNKNAHIEAFNSILEMEFFQVRYFQTFGQAYEETVDFIENYNTKRIHGSLGYKTPQEIYDLYDKGCDMKVKEVSL